MLGSDNIVAEQVHRYSSANHTDILHHHTSFPYTVRTGDTLWSIAAEQLGEGTDASVIYDYALDIYSANREALGRNADLLYEGQVLQIPEQPLQTFRR